MKWASIIIPATTLLTSAFAYPGHHNDCSDVQKPYHPCQKILHPDGSLIKCSKDWLDTLAKCKKTGCVAWKKDPSAECDCKLDNNVCKKFTEIDAIPHKKCKREWWTALKECKAAGCIKWIRDPADDCRKNVCKKSEEYICKKFDELTKKHQCTPIWKEWYRKCKETGCRKWIKDPLSECKCKPCADFTKYQGKKCTKDWFSALNKCKATGCVQWIRDPAADCFKPPVKPKCEDKYHPCKTYPSKKKCSKEWRDEVIKCKESNCIVWIQDPLNECPIKQ